MQKVLYNKDTILFIVVFLVTFLTISSLSAKELPWQSNFIGCSTATSPYIDEHLLSLNPRPLLKIGTMQAWAVSDKNGGEEIVLTTEDGLTIYGRIIGPQGEDMSAALLGTVSSFSKQQLHSKISEPQIHSKAQQTATPQSKSSNKTEKQSIVIDKRPSSQIDISPPQMASIGSQNVDPTPTAETLDQLIGQAIKHAMWFRLGKPKEDAPTFFLIADPTCPHCAWVIDSLRSKIETGALDLRVILAPIRSSEAFNIAASILHAQNAGEAFLQHEYSITGSGRAVQQIMAAKIDPNVTKALGRNVLWMRQNGIKGVPFFLYRTREGAQFIFGNLNEQALQAALPIVE